MPYSLSNPSYRAIQQDMENHVVVAVSAVVLIILAIIIALTIVITRCKNKPAARSVEIELPSLPVDIVPGLDTSDAVGEPNLAVCMGLVTGLDRVSNTYYNSTASFRHRRGRAVKVVDFGAYMTDSSIENVFVNQYQTLPSGFVHPAKVATRPENAGKHRYGDIVAYDHTRVVLQTLPYKPGSDYINSNFIKGYSGNVSYIASQGPTEENIGDFWRMIWEQDVRTIAMVTNMVEAAKRKCNQYWGRVGEVMLYGPVIVRNEREHVFAEFTIRHFSISLQGNQDRSRHVKQFHYTAWPDKGVPRCTTGLLHFWRKVRHDDENKTRVWLVHCSAGVGRTGTFIALDILYDQGRASGRLDVFQTVLDLRQQRVKMVQVQEQYILLHKLLMELFVLPSQPVPIEQFSPAYTLLKKEDPHSGCTKLYMEYQTLRNENRKPSLKAQSPGNKAADESMYTSAKQKENRIKNRYRDILADDNFRPYLSTDAAGCSNYINAVCIPSYCHRYGYILTQTPLPNTAVDFCRLLYEQEVRIVVTFDNYKNEKVGVCFPDSRSLKVGPFTMIHVTDNNNEINRTRTYKLLYKHDERTIVQISFSHWPTKVLVPADPYKMYAFIERLEEMKKNDTHPVVIQCLNGAERSGLCAALMNILEYAKFDGEVSIPQVIRHMRTCRQQIIPNFEQYKFCYDFFQCFAESHTTYANI